MKKYRLDMDFLLSHLDFTSRYNMAREDGALFEVREKDRDAFIGEITGRFVALLNKSLEEVVLRGEVNPFDRVKVKIEEDSFGFHSFTCPICKGKNYKDDWDSAEDTRPRCLYCEKPIWMKKKT